MTSPYRIPWLERVDGAAWIAQSLGPDAGRVRSLVPPLYPSYLRVTVRAEHGAGDNPDCRLRDGLISLVRRGGVEADRCTFGVCDVYGWNGRDSIAVPLADHGDLVDTTDPLTLIRRFAGTDIGRTTVSAPYPHPTLDLPLRSYMLYRGAVEDAAHVVDADAPRGLPDLWWPDDRSWFVATDTDLDFAVLAGPQRLTGGVAGLPALHAVIVDPDSDLA